MLLRCARKIADIESLARTIAQCNDCAECAKIRQRIGKQIVERT